MPKLTLLLGRKTVQVYDIDRPSLTIGREEGVDIHVDNPSVSRQHAEIRQEGGSWIVEDLGSSNGTYVNGRKIEGGEVIRSGDEIGFGKFSLVFDRVVGSAEPAASRAKSGSAGGMSEFEGTMHIKPHEVSDLLEKSAKKRSAQIKWESGGRQGTHYFRDAPAILMGRDELCDVRVPKGPKHHLLFIRDDKGYEARDLTFWGRMKVRGSSTRRARLKDGDVLEIAGLKVTFMGEVG